MKLLFNAAAIPSPGKYEYSNISQDQAIKWLKQGYDKSFVGYPDTAGFIKFDMQPGDEALIVKLKYRLQDPTQKEKFTPSDEDYEFGILKKME